MFSGGGEEKLFSYKPAEPLTYRNTDFNFPFGCIVTEDDVLLAHDGMLPTNVSPISGTLGTLNSLPLSDSGN